MLKYIDHQVGDRVKPLADSRAIIIKMGQKGPGWTNAMEVFIGQECIIVDINFCNAKPVSYDLRLAKENSSPVFTFPGRCLILLERAKVDDKRNDNIKIRKHGIENVHIDNIPSMHNKEVVYTISLEVKPENYEQTVEAIISDGEIVSGAMPNRIPICAKIYINADVDGAKEMADIFQRIEECDVENLEVQNIEIRKIPVGHK